MNNTKWLCNERVRLRAPEPEDLDLMYQMENDTTLWSISNTVQPYSRYTLREYISSSTHDIYSDKQVRFIIELTGGERVGAVDLADFNPHDSRAEVCIGILGKYCGQGIAYEALKLICDYAIRFLGLHQLYAYIPADHEISKKLFFKAEFTEIATLKEWKRDGENFVDISIFQLLKG